MTNWRLLARGQVVMQSPRYVMIQDTINHWSHHRGQMTVYRRLMGAKSLPFMVHQQMTISFGKKNRACGRVTGTAQGSVNAPSKGGASSSAGNPGGCRKTRQLAGQGLYDV